MLANRKSILIVCFSFFSISCSLDWSSEAISKSKDTLEENKYSCPDEYVYVPAREGVAPPGFCVAKYEMKDVSGVATSQAGGAPWGNIDRDDAILACSSLGAGYDLISNAQWMQIADNVTDVASNWSSGALTSGALNRGHFDDNFGGLLEAGGDAHPCYGLDFDMDGNADSEASLDAICSESIWHENRRTLKLSTGKVLWDFAGNSWEWNKDDYAGGASGSNYYIAELSVVADSFATLFAPAVASLCGNPNLNDYCGMGFAWINGPGGAIARGGSLYNGTDTGAYAVDLDNGAGYTAGHVGFRCVAQAMPK